MLVLAASWRAPAKTQQRLPSNRERPSHLVFSNEFYELAMIPTSIYFDSSNSRRSVPVEKLIQSGPCPLSNETKMKSCVRSIIKFLREDDGPTAVEYAVMLAVIVVVCLTAITSVGTTASAKFTAVKNAISN